MATDKQQVIEGLQRVFVGRETELGQVVNAFDRAVDGHGSLALVVGEPGIGKTTLIEHLAPTWRNGVAKRWSAIAMRRALFPSHTYPSLKRCEPTCW